MCEFNTKITIAHLLRLTIVSAKSKIYSPRRGYLSPGNSIVLEIMSSYFIIHRRHKFLPILLKLKHAFKRPVYLRELCTRCGPIVTADLHSLTLLQLLQPPTTKMVNSLQYQLNSRS